MASTLTYTLSSSRLYSKSSRGTAGRRIPSLFPSSRAPRPSRYIERPEGARTESGGAIERVESGKPRKDRRAELERERESGRDHRKSRRPRDVEEPTFEGTNAQAQKTDPVGLRGSQSLVHQHRSKRDDGQRRSQLKLLIEDRASCLQRKFNRKSKSRAFVRILGLNFQPVRQV